MMDHRELFPTPRNDDSLLLVGRHTNHADQTHHTDIPAAVNQTPRSKERQWQPE